jgi:GntR family transcriptional regulator, vanillate catabolism transcriptional regulator
MITVPYTPSEDAGPTRSSAAAAKLRQALRQGMFKPNEHLAEAELAKFLSVSRTPVREALKTLSQEGLVTYFPNRGYVVRACSFEDVANAYVVRRTLEALACRLAARNGLTIDHRVRMAYSIEKSLELIDSGTWRQDFDTWARLNSAFHACIIEAAHNTPLARAINDTLRMPILAKGEARIFTRYDLLRFFDDKAMRLSCEEHVQIFEALMKRREDAAAETMEHHIGRAGKIFERCRKEFEEKSWTQVVSTDAELPVSG